MAALPIQKQLPCFGLAKLFCTSHPAARWRIKPSTHGVTEDADCGAAQPSQAGRAGRALFDRWEKLGWWAVPLRPGTPAMAVHIALARKGAAIFHADQNNQNSAVMALIAAANAFH